MADVIIIIQGGNKPPKKTTFGWELLPQMKEGLSKWVLLKDIKKSNPAELYTFEVENKTDHKPAFSWCVSFTLRKWNRIVSKPQNK